jgi:hypothetical protein
MSLLQEASSAQDGLVARKTGKLMLKDEAQATRLHSARDIELSFTKNINPTTSFPPAIQSLHRAKPNPTLNQSEAAN